MMERWYNVEEAQETTAELVTHPDKGETQKSIVFSIWIYYKLSLVHNVRYIWYNTCVVYRPHVDIPSGGRQRIYMALK